MTDADRSSSLPALLRATVMLLLAGASVGFFASFLEQETHSQRGWIVAAVMALIGAGALFLLVRDFRRWWQATAAMPTQERRASRILAVSIATGFVLGGATMLLGRADHELLPEAGSMSPVLAVVIAAAVLVIGPWTSRRWWLATDEHERMVYTEAAHIAASAVLYIGIGWWLLSRAALVPPPDAMALLLGMCVIWSFVWLQRKYA